MLLLASNELMGIPLQKFSASVISAQPRTQYIWPTSETLLGLNCLSTGIA